MRISKNREERKLEIVEASFRLFKEKGYEETSVEDIVSSIKVAKGLFYYYFKKKDDVLYEIELKIVEEIKAGLEEIEKSDYPSKDKLKKVLQIYFEKLKENSFIKSSEDSDLNSFKSQLQDVACRSIYEIIKEDNVFKNKKHGAMLIKVLISGFSDLYLSGIKESNIYAEIFEDVTGIKIK